MSNDPLLPQWAPRVPPWKVRRLYELDAQGIYDDELIDEIGYGLLCRCQSFVQAVAAVRGRAVCPQCGQTVLHAADRQEMLRCACGWELTWGAYFATIQHKQLSGAEPVLDLFGEYVLVFPKAKTAQKKMVLIDQLLHGFHWYYKDNSPTRPVAVNLLEGRLGDVISFLDALTYGDKGTPGLRETKLVWEKRIQPARGWSGVKHPTEET